jgi:hypothetical protein
VREAEARRLLAEESARPFDLARGPLWRVLLLRLDALEHWVPITLHHIVSDAWSAGVLFREVATLYRAFAAKGESALPELPVQYTDFAAWQRGWLAGDVLERELDYWRGRLAGAPQLLTLSSARPRPEVPTYLGATRPVAFPVELSQGLTALGRKQGVTLFMTFLALWDVLLRHLSGSDDVVVGTDVANRNRAETEALIGFFINQLVLRSDLSGDPTFAELLGRVRESTLGAYAHQDVPFDHLVDALQLPRTARHARPLRHAAWCDRLAQLQHRPVRRAGERPPAAPARGTRGSGRGRSRDPRLRARRGARRAEAAGSGGRQGGAERPLLRQVQGWNAGAGGVLRGMTTGNGRTRRHG